MWAVVALAVGLSAAAGGARGQWLQAFEGNVTVLGSAGVSGGIEGRVFYSFAEKARRIDFDIGVPGQYSQVSEILDYGEGLRRLYCSSCESETYREPLEELWPEPSAGWSPAAVATNITSADGRVCQRFERAAGNRGEGLLWEMYAHAASGTLCRATWDDSAVAGTQDVGETLEFAAVTALADATVLETPAAWNCSDPNCRVAMDLVLVLDRSGSIDSSEWDLVVSFTELVVQSYSIAPDLVRIAVVFFDDDGDEYVYMNLATGSDQFVAEAAVSNMPKGSGATCIPCGLELAHQELSNNGRPNVGHLIITMTDGRNNRRDGEIVTEAAIATSQGIVLYSLGVGSGIRQQDLIEAAGNDTSRVFISPSFQELSDIVANITTETCTELPGNPCGTGCRGFCACGQTCLCPTTCNGVDKCITGVCIAGQAGNGCQFVPTTCNDNNECTDDGCNNATGCTYTPFPPSRCMDNNACTQDSCNPNVANGCQNVPLNPAVACNDGNACTADLCIPATGCDNSTAQPCSFCPMFDVEANCGVNTNCTTYTCGENATAAFCVETPVSCDDGNECSVDTCNPASGCEYAPLVCDDGDACTTNTCNASTGCVFPPAPPCDDNSVCTVDTCDSATGCVFTPAAPCDDGNNCTVDSCNSITGCVFNVRDCSSIASDACHYGLCDPAVGCVDTLIPGAQIVCGECNGDKDPDNCDGLAVDTTAAVALGATAIILIAAGIAIFLALAALGGKKGYDLLMSGKDAELPAGGSDLYDGGNMAGENPFSD